MHVQNQWDCRNLKFCRTYTSKTSRENCISKTCPLITKVFGLVGESNHSKKFFSDFNLFFSIFERCSHLICSNKLMVPSNVWDKFLTSKCSWIFFKNTMMHSPRLFSVQSMSLLSFNWKATVLIQHDVKPLNKPLECNLKRALVILTQCFLHSLTPSILLNKSFSSRE